MENKEKSKLQYFKEQLTTFGTQLVSGGGAGAISKTLVAPLERIKVILQVGGEYNGIMDALVRIPKEQGFLSFWRGNGANVIRIFPNAAIKFTMYDRYKQLLLPKGEQNYVGAEKIVRKLASGGLSGATMLSLTYPMDLARTRLTADSGKVKKYNGLGHCIAKTVKDEGISGLYKGIGISLCGIVPYLALSFASYDTLNTFLPKDKESKKKLWYPWAKLGVGCAAGLFSQSATYPIDTIRRRLQMDGLGGKERKYKGAFDCGLKMLKNEGIPSLYKGLFANAIKGAPGSAIQFVAYDYIKQFLLNLKNKKKKTQQ